MHKSVRFLVILLVSFGLSLAAHKAPAAQPGHLTDAVEVVPSRVHDHRGHDHIGEGVERPAETSMPSVLAADAPAAGPQENPDTDRPVSEASADEPTTADPTESEAETAEDDMVETGIEPEVEGGEGS
ncbi:MAG: hypothetical protein AAGF01_31960, partial [Cyanobacteria bacterium P01_G01_bin.38]